MNFKEILALIVCCLYNLSLLSGAVYLVIQYHWSAWWVALAVILTYNYKSPKNADISNNS